jgi:diacylglycerol kinase (ATP)
MRPAKTQGLVHLIASARYSLQGLARLAREPAFRHETAMTGFVLAAMLAAGVPVARVVVAVAMLLIVFAFEALNTAIEEIVDRVSPEFSPTAKHAKDLGSAAVMLSLVAAYGFCVFNVVSALAG